jgi:Scramblase
MLSWDFTLADLHGNLIGSINRNFRGFGREIFTDTGQYVIRLDAASPETTNIKNSGVVRRFPKRKTELSPAFEVKALSRDSKGYLAEMEGELAGMALIQGKSVNGLTLDQRAVMLATAVSIDFDYFSHTSGYSCPMWSNLVVLAWECGRFGCLVEVLPIQGSPNQVLQSQRRPVWDQTVLIRGFILIVEVRPVRWAVEVVGVTRRVSGDSNLLHPKTIRGLLTIQGHKRRQIKAGEGGIMVATAATVEPHTRDFLARIARRASARVARVNRTQY